MAVPCLPLPARKEVTVAYLLFRIADTIEDGVHLDRAEKLAALDRVAELLSRGSELPPNDASLSFPRPPSDNPHYLTLLEETPSVIDSIATLRPQVRTAIIASAHLSLRGMKQFTAAGTTDGKIRIQSVTELRDYCYFVAGVVGEMLTDIFVSGAEWLADVRAELDANARWFGEGLQLVNILKDSDDDQREGRVFIPRTALRPELFDLAREDLLKAEAYVRVLKEAEAPRGFVAFTELPLRLAWRTLESVERLGPGSKVPRSEVMDILAQTAFAS